MTPVLAAVGVILDLTTAALTMLGKAQQVSGVIIKAQSEGRDKLTDEEWAQITAQADLARDKLQKAIDAYGTISPTSPTAATPTASATSKRDMPLLP